MPVRVLDVGSESRWNRVLVVGFERLERAEAWVLDNTSMTERSIAATRSLDLAALVFAVP